LCNSQEIEADEESELPVIVKKDSTVVGQVEGKRFRFTPFIAPAVSPEVGFMLIAGGLISFKLEKDNPKLQRSSIPFSIGYSTNGSFNMNFRPAIFGKQDKFRISGDIWLKDMPDNYWGVGFENGESPSKPDSTTNYSRFWWQVFLRNTFKLKQNFYGGLIVDFNQTKARDVNSTMAQDPNILADGRNITNWGLGLIAQYDTRDFTVNAYEGLFIELSSTFYFSEASGNKKYQVFMLDYRQYKTIKREGSTLAWQVRSRYGNNDVPWPEMSQLGTPFDLRAYRWGRYRDKTMLFGIAEYRYMFMRKKPRKDGNMMSRFGAVGWLATGSIGDTFGQLNNWLPNAGIGFRFEIQTRMNVRVDYGFGNDTNALYISFNEAF
jgi:hypothetical protein